jgi:FG-GAP-like repeat
MRRHDAAGSGRRILGPSSAIGIGGLIALLFAGSAHGQACSTPTFGVPFRVYSPATGTSAPGDFLMADLTGDGRADLVLVDTSDDAIVLLPRTDAGFGSPHVLHPGALLLRAADFDGDGRLDLVAIRKTEMQVIFVDADGTLRAGPSTPLPDSPLRPALGLLTVFDSEGSRRWRAELRTAA